MATIPKQVTISNTSVDVVNAIRNSATIDYKSRVPIATADADSIKLIGSIIMDSPDLLNNFSNALFGRIARVLINSKLYSNPWSGKFKNGVLELGETVEEIFVNIASAQEFDDETAESEVFKREKPDIKSAFHVMNFTKFYKVTTTRDMWRTAFLSWENLESLLYKVIESLTSAAAYDEFLLMKYLLARRLLNGQIETVTISSDLTESAIKQTTAKVRAASNKFEFLSSNYNLAGVYTHTEKVDQYVIVNAEYDAYMDVLSLASAFNMDKAEFMGHRTLYDGFSNADMERLNELLESNPDYVPLTSDDIEALEKVPVILIDREFFKIFDNVLQSNDIFNPQGLYTNHILHKWTTFSTSPFANAVAFVSEDSEIEEIAISPSTATVEAGASLQLAATVSGSSFASKVVNWTLNADAPATINTDGVLVVDSDAEDETEITVTATSAADSTVTATATITVSAE